jgi:hypothetical protein
MLIIRRSNSEEQQYKTPGVVADDVKITVQSQSKQVSTKSWRVGEEVVTAAIMDTETIVNLPYRKELDEAEKKVKQARM